MPKVATVRDTGTVSLAGVGGDSGPGNGGRQSPVRGSNPRPVPKSGFPHKELLWEDQEGSKVLC